MSKLFGGGQDKTVRMPDLESPVIKDAQRRKQAQIQGRSGRSSTMLSRGASPGTGAYQASVLGSAA